MSQVVNPTWPEWDEWSVRTEICEVGQRLYHHFFVAANDGNISVRLNEDEVIITPTNFSKGFMAPEDIIKLTLDGRLIASHTGRDASSAHRMHLTIYEHRPDIRAVVHAHPPTATGLAVAGIGLDKPLLPETVARTGPCPPVPSAIPGGDGSRPGITEMEAFSYTPRTEEFNDFWKGQYTGITQCNLVPDNVPNI